MAGTLPMTFPAEHPNKMNAASGLRRWLLALGVSLATSLLVIGPFFWLGSASGARGTGWSSVLRCESVRVADRLHAQRLCGATRVRTDAAVVAGLLAIMRAGGESPDLPAAGNGDLRGSVRGCVAFERACRGAGQLQHGACFCV